MVEKVKCKNRACTNYGTAIPPLRARVSQDGKGKSVCGACGEVMAIVESRNVSGVQGARKSGRPNRRD